ncbi:MAG: ATP-dependent RNA helicase HrpA [Xanthomonadales bacterium]|nr:ATP-dependent RNA helicase HrpA [Xanthomonadales bacterium]
MSKSIENIGERRARLLGRLCGLPLLERPRWRRRLQAAVSLAALEDLEGALDRRAAAWAARNARLPRAEVRPELPIAAQAEALAAAIAAHPVVIVAGETGSGKTTQLPKIALAAGRGREGLIGLTQPRRLAARAAARRLAAELGAPLGGIVGFETRFERALGPELVVKCMTDGILLAELASDRRLLRYDTLILDEVHERNLNIDLLLGHLRTLLPSRPELRVVLSSATLEAERLSRFFGGAPVMAIAGRSHPVEIRWRPPPGGEPLAPEAILPVLAEIEAESDAGDVLLFLPGEREIRELHRALRAALSAGWEILPLYGRLPGRWQDRVFAPGSARRLVLATNIAETSLTVPRIRYVIDTGLVRLARHSPRLGITRLVTERASQASAIQRAGRCGRLGPGVCYRLEEEASFAERARHADPEIRRSSLATVLLRLLALGVREPERFPFLDPPSPRALREGLRELAEIGALASGGGLSATGRQMARLPVDARLARVVVEGARLGVLEETLVVAAFLSIQDPREQGPGEPAPRPAPAGGEAGSDYLGLLALWREFAAARAQGSAAALRQWCEDRRLSLARMREWLELHRELRLAAARAGLANADAASAHALERALLAGFPSFIGRRDERGEYRGPRGRRFRPAAGSVLAAGGARWILGAPLLQTERTVALLACRIDPRWLEQQASQVIARRVFDPRLEPESGRIVAFEELGVEGLVIEARRRIDFARRDPAAARRLFLREGLALARWEGPHPWLEGQRRLLAEAEGIAARLRRGEVLRPPEAIAELLAARLPPEVVDGPSFARWWRQAGEAERERARLGLGELLAVDPAEAEPFPACLAVAGRPFPLRYRFAPGAEDDGVSLELPLELLGALEEGPLSWLVPGLLHERVTALIRALPKGLRRHFAPAPEFARAFLESQPPRDRALAATLGDFLERVTGVAVPPEAWNEAAIPAHLRLRLALLGERGELVAAGRDLAALRRELGERARALLSERLAAADRREALREFPALDFREPNRRLAGVELWPALVGRAGEVLLEYFERREQAGEAHAGGCRALLAAELEALRRRLLRQLPLDPATPLRALPVGGAGRLREQVLEGAFAELFDAHWPRAPALDPEGYRALRTAVEEGWFAAAVARLELCERALAEAAAVAPRLKPPLLGYAAASYEDLRRRFEALLAPDFPARLTRERLAELPRYLRALARRAERIERDPLRDEARMLELAELEAALARIGDERSREALSWQLEELRVAIFAPELGTREPVSLKRLRRALGG